MFKKIAILAIVTTLFITANLFAGDDMPGIVVTLIDRDEIVITDQLIVCEMRVGGQTFWGWGFTDEDGEVSFGAAGDEGIYFMTTVFNGNMYNTTVAKNPGQRLYTWKLGDPQYPE